MASGGSNSDHGRLGSFKALYPQAPYFSESALVAPADLIDVFPKLTVQPWEAVSVEIGLGLRWRTPDGSNHQAEPA